MFSLSSLCSTLTTNKKQKNTNTLYCNYSEFNICKDSSGIDFTSICEEVSTQLSQVNSLLFSGQSTTEICESLSFCGDTSDVEYSTKPAINMDIINAVNNDDSLPWKASAQSRFKKLTLKDVRVLLGTIVDDEYKHTLPVISRGHIESSSLPTDFDSRTQWSNCADVIGHIRDQSACGCSWVFGSTEAYNDRMCITSDGSFQQLLSVEDTCACCNFLKCDSDGCNGGQPTEPREWFESNGVVSGGDHDDIGGNDTCDPFTVMSYVLFVMCLCKKKNKNYKKTKTKKKNNLQTFCIFCFFFAFSFVCTFLFPFCFFSYHHVLIM